MPPFVGRADELSAMVDAFDECRRDQRSIVVAVGGEPGCGASRLAGQLHVELERRRLGHAWWVGRCTRGVPLPYEPIGGLLRAVDGGASAWLREASTVAGRDGEHGAFALLVGLADRMRAAARDTPLVAFVDDVDGADPSTIRLLAGLPALLDDSPVLLVTAGRRGKDATVPAAGDEAIVRADLEVLVKPLPPDDAEALVRAMAPGLTDEEVAGAARASVGRPALAAALAESGDHRDALGSALAVAGPQAATAVCVAWMTGGWLADEQAAARTGLDATAWHALRERNIVVPSSRSAGGSVPASELWVDAALASVGALVRPLASRVAEALAEASAPAAAIATCWEHAGRDAEAASAWEQAADEAERDFAIATAAAALRRAVELGGTDTLVRLGRRTGELSLAAGDREDADRVAERLLPRLARSAAIDTIGVHLLRYRARSEAGLPGADDQLDAALQVPAPPCREHVDALVVDALRRVLDDPAHAAEQAAAAITEADGLGDLAAMAAALGAAGLAAAIAGDVDGGLAHLDRAVDAAARAGDGAAEARLASNRVYVLWRAGWPADVERAAALELDRLAVRGMSALGDQLAVGRAAALVTLGRYDDAELAIASGRTMRTASDATALLDLVDAELALVRGEVDRARTLIDRAASSPARAVPEVAADLHLRRAELALALADPRSAAEAAMAGLHSIGGADSVAAARLVLAWWRAGGPSSDRERRLLPGLTAVGAEAEAVMATIAAITAPPAAKVDAWHLAERSWAAVPSPLESWRCRVAIARETADVATLDRLIDEARAIGAFGPAREAEDAWRSAGGRRSVRRGGGLLTDREVEVLELVGQGLTNRAIGERLFISTRTVGAHLERCMAKLEVSTRGAAVHEARRQGLLTS
ncbi:MAG: LuxR C-terminal-related transcriptional regulator [Ilumatobacteraceae bacterium]